MWPPPSARAAHGDSTIWTSVAKVAEPDDGEAHFWVLNQKAILGSLAHSIKKEIVRDRDRYSLKNVVFEAYNAQDLYLWAAEQQIPCEVIHATSTAQVPAFMTKAWFESSTVEGLTINNFLAKLQASARDRIISAGRRALIEGKGVQAAARMIRMIGTLPTLRLGLSFASLWGVLSFSMARRKPQDKKRNKSPAG